MFLNFGNPRQRLDFNANQVQPCFNPPQTPPSRQFKQMCQLIVVVPFCLSRPITFPNRHQFVQRHPMCPEFNVIRLNSPQVGQDVSTSFQPVLNVTVCLSSTSNPSQFVSSDSNSPQKPLNRLNLSQVVSSFPQTAPISPSRVDRNW